MCNNGVSEQDMGLGDWRVEFANGVSSLGNKAVV